MAHELLMPRQGNTVESCIILEWRKDEGDTVAAGDVVCEVETDKASFEVEATEAGTLLKRFFEEGADVPVLTPIAVIGQEGEDISGMGPSDGDGKEAAAGQAGKAEPAGQAGRGASAPQPAAVGRKPAAAVTEPEAPAEAGAAGGEPAEGGDGRVRISPRARKLAADRGIAYEALAGRGSGPGGRIIEQDIRESGEPLTPAAAERRAASGQESPERGTGIGGRVRARDLAEARGEPAPGSQAAPGVAAAAALEYPGPYDEVPVKGPRKIIAERMLDSLQTTAQLTMHASADARSILAYRAKLKESKAELELRDITINDIVLVAAVRTIKRFPELNAHFNGDSIRRFDHVHAAFAVDTERGLMVPVIRFADTLSLREIALETDRLNIACQKGSVNPDELSGGTFTVTNLGALGIEMFTPVLNPPQAAILGVCSIEPKAVMKGGEVEFVPHIGLSLTIDHRAVDGAPAARFLKVLTSMIAQFELVLAG